MNWKYLTIFICTTFAASSGFGQSRSMKDLIGKWKETSVPKGKDTAYFMFVNDTTFVIKTANGHKTIGRCRFDFSKNPIILTSMNSLKVTLSLEFIDNDKLIYKGLKTGSHDNTKNKKYLGITLAKVDSKDYSYLVEPTLSDLKGSWMYDRYTFIEFINDTLASVKDGSESPILYTYTVDFTKFPYWVDFRSQEDGKTLHGIFTFPTDSTMVFESFRRNNRKDDFTTFGAYTYTKIDSAKKAILLKRRQQN